MKNDILFNYLYSQAYNLEKPLSVTIELLTKCNLKCQHCYIPHRDHSGISFNTMYRLLHELKNLGVLNVSLTGGEPFLRDDIFDIIQIARSLHMRVVLLSNGTCLSRDKIQQLSKLNIARFSTTIFSLDEQHHDYITQQKGSLKKLLENLMYMKEYGIHVHLKTPLLKINQNDFYNIKEFAQKNGFEYSVSPVIFAKLDGDTSPINLRLSKFELSQIYRDVDLLKSNSQYTSMILLAPP